MIEPELLAQVENYLLWRCLDKKWFEHREQIGKPVDVKKLFTFEYHVEWMKRSGKYNPKEYAFWLNRTKENIKEVQDGLAEAAMGDEPLPITDAERAKMLETHRNYFANYLFDLMRQKNFTEAEVAAKAHVDAAIFDRLRNDRKYIPQERTIWVLVLALELTFGEANSLLHRARFFLNAAVQVEVLMAFFLDKGVYDLPTVNEVLIHYGFEPLEVHEDFSAPPAKNFSDEALLDKIYIHLEKNYREPLSLEEQRRRGWKFSISRSEPKPPKGTLKTFEVIIRKLKNKIGLAGSFFSDYLFKLIKQKNLSDVEVYKAAHLDRRVFSKIRNEINYMPAKKTVVAIAFALKLDIEETNNLLACAGYFLSNGRKEDVIAKYFIDNRIYDLFLLNEVLDYYGCPLIGD